MDELIMSERERCASIVEEYWPLCHGNEETTIVRIIEKIRFGHAPERDNDDFFAMESTTYAHPQTVDDERGRCLNCVLLHPRDGTTRLQDMLCEIAHRIARRWKAPDTSSE